MAIKKKAKTSVEEDKEKLEPLHTAMGMLGFSRQEYWSGVPFPSPMHESEK